MVKNGESIINNKEEILSIAIKYFYKHGYDNTSTRNIAKASNLSIAGLYYYFKDKESILFNILDRSITILYELLSNAVKAEEDPRTNLTRIIESIIKRITEEKKEVTLLLKESNRLTPNHLQIIKNKKRMCLEIVKHELDRLKDSGELKLLNTTAAAFFLIGLTSWVHYWYDPSKSIKPKELSNSITEIFFNGILN